jgi:hypothetical protein
MGAAWKVSANGRPSDLRDCVIGRSSAASSARWVVDVPEGEETPRWLLASDGELWRRRYVTKGVDGLLKDATRPSRRKPLTGREETLEEFVNLRPQWWMPFIRPGGVHF